MNEAQYREITKTLGLDPNVSLRKQATKLEIIKEYLDNTNRNWSSTVTQDGEFAGLECGQLLIGAGPASYKWRACGSLAKATTLKAWFEKLTEQDADRVKTAYEQLIA